MVLLLGKLELAGLLIVGLVVILGLVIVGLLVIIRGLLPSTTFVLCDSIQAQDRME